MFLRRYILLLLTLLSFTLQAQQYPVDIQVFITPPYPQSLRGYADSFEQKIQAHFLLKDLSTGGRPFALRFSLENFQGQTIAQTPDYITPYLVNLSPGVRRTLTNIDFKSLLRYENLYGINEATYNGLLPEGTYFIGLSLYDVATGRPVSNKGRAMIQVRRYSPPVLTMPQKGEVLTKKNAFQNILFQWMPRDIAPFMQYEFTLKEVWDLALVPEEAFMSGRLVYQTKTNAPALQYTNMMPILLENKRYVWQVRALTNNPTNPNEQSYFRNNGNSETFYFDLVSNCEAPRMLTAMTESTSAQLRWSAQAMMPNQEYPYKVMYRERGKSWKSQKVSMPYAKVTGLKRGRTYIYKVGVACGLNAANSTSVFGEDSYVYSTEQEFTTTEQIDEKSQVQCGVKPEIRIKNTEPLQDNLYPNTTFTAGDFPVTVLNATGSNGIYSGEGYVKVPYLQDTKIKVVFNGIKLNTERQLIDGKLVTTYDETERNVQFIQEGIGEVFGDKGKKDQKMPFEIENENNIQVDSITGRITITGKVDLKTGIAPKVTLPKGRDYVITDSQGKVYQLDESGKVTAKGTREQGTQLAQQAGKGDSKNPPISNKHFKVEWLFNDELANDTTGEIPYKALVKGKTSSFELRIQPADTTQYDFFFHTENGVKVEAESKGEGLYKITRKGAFDFAQEEVWVVAKEKKEKKGKKEELIGKCILVHLSPKEVNVALVPTRSGQNLQEAIAQVQQIYEKVGVALHITTEPPFDISDQLKNGILPTENEFGDLSTYSPEQNAVIAKFATNRKPKDNTYYIFLVNDGTGDHGYMRLGGQYGFVYSANARTIAHELGHGIFKLEHPFKGKNADKGKTTALMDYNEGQDFFYRDWKQINDPKVKLYAFQKQSEGEYKAWKFLIGTTVEQIPGYENKEKSFISPTSSVITLPAKARDFSFVKGTLIGFTIADERWIALFSKNDSIFKGYYKDAKQDKNENFEIVGKNYFTYKQNKNLIQEIFYVSPSQCNEVNIYKGKISKEAFFSENGGVGSAYFSNIVFDNIKGLSNWELLSTASDPLNCLKKTQREFYKFIIEHYREHNVQISETDKETLRNILSKFADVRISGLDAPPAYAIQVKYDEMLKTGIKELIYDLQTNIEKEIGKNEELLKNTSLLIVLDDFKRIHDKYLFYEHLIEIVDKDCVFGEKFRELRDKDGKMKPFLEVAKLIIDGTYEILSLNELFENTTCVLKMLRIPPNVWNSDRIDYKTADFFKEFLEKLGFDTNNVILSSLLNAQFELGAPCSCGMWNSTVDLVAGISDFGAGISQNPTDLVKGINNFISALFQSDTWEAMGDALKKHHGVYNTSVKTPQAVYGACYDAIFVASFFVGAGEIKALSEASSFADVMRVVGKVGSNGKAFVVSLSKIPNVATQKAALFLADHCTEVLRILPKEGKIYIYSKLIDAELARFTAQGIELLPQAGKIEQVLFETTEEITDVNGKTGKLIVGKDAQGKIVLEIAGEAIDIKTLLTNKEYKKIFDDFVNGKVARKSTKELSLEEEAVFKFYTNKSYYSFNQALLSGNRTADIIEIEKLLNKALDKIPSSSGTYYRGIGKKEIEMLSKYKIGDEITYKNFLSTSSEKEKAIEFYYSNINKTGLGGLVEVISKNGKRIDKFSDITEWEVLHKSKTMFELIEIDKSYILNIDDVLLEGAKPIKLTKYTIKEK